MPRRGTISRRLDGGQWYNPPLGTVVSYREYDVDDLEGCRTEWSRRMSSALGDCGYAMNEGIDPELLRVCASQNICICSSISEMSCCI